MRKVKHGLTAMLAASTVMLSASHVLANPVLEPLTSTTSVSYEPIYFRWEEDISGQKCLEESGWIHALGVDTSLLAPVGNGNQAGVDLGFSIYGGSVDYDGHNWAGSSLKTETAYAGYRIAIDGKYVIRNLVVEDSELSPYLSLSRESWHRSIATVPSAIGYTENWTAWFLETGVGFGKEIAEGYSLYVNAGIRRSFKISNDIPMADVEVSPKGDWGYKIKIGVELKDYNLDASITYCKDSFKQSDPVWSSAVGDFVFQPDSERRLIGIKIIRKF